MAIVTNFHTPDTCVSAENLNLNCRIAFDVDTVTGVISNSRPVRLCSVHASLTGTDEQKAAAIRNENARGWANALPHILNNGPTSLYDTVNGIREPKNTIRVSWSWTGVPPNRILTVTLTGASLTTTQRNTIQNALNTRFGTGNVVLG